MNNSDYFIFGAIILLGISIFTFGFSLFNLTQSDSITGFASSDEGNVSLEVEGVASINFTVDRVNWGTGSVDGGTYALLNTGGDVTGGTWTPVSAPLNLTNIGNSDVVVNLTSNKDASEFIGGGASSGIEPVFNISISNIYAGACGIADFSGYKAIDTDNYLTCTHFNYSHLNDTININVQLIIPVDAETGEKEAVITATARTAI